MAPSIPILTPDLKFYGRRKGRPLPARQGRLMASDFGHFSITLPQDQSPVDPLDYFGGVYDRVGLEMGFGGGEHLAARAAQNPRQGFIGIEAFENGVASLLEHIKNNDLTNVRIYNNDGRHLLRALKPASLDEIFVLFPDPWPKKRHHKRRLLNDSFVQNLFDLLKPGGKLLIATDHNEYAVFIHGVLARAAGFAPLSPLSSCAVRPPDMPKTRYEQKALDGGRSSYYFQMRRG